MLFLIRHCSTSENEAGILCSDKDYILSENGQQQGRKLSEWFTGKKLDLILTSNLLRTQQTSEFISQTTKAEIKVYEQLAERNVGFKYANLELKAINEIRSQENKEIIDPTQDWAGVSEVESDELVFNRTKDILQKHIEVGKNIACVTHAGVIKAFLHTVLHIDKSRSNAFKVRNACVLIFQNENNFEQIQLIGMYQIREL
ncbi:MAG: histidine phosphatase family protein [Bacteroidales bacterium]|nr:histidine phosphatase family protein [Bacteroidales bacterium]